MELHWQPDPSRARLERAALSRFLGTQLGKAFECDPLELEREIGGDLVHPASISVGWAVQAGRTPALSRADVVRTIVESRDRARKTAADGMFAVDLVPPDDAVVARTVERHQADSARFDDLEPITFYQPEDLDFRKPLREAHSLVATCWPDMLEEMSVTLCCLTFFTAGMTIGFTDIYTHGMVGIRASDLLQPVVLAEEIIHESSHVRLNGLLSSTTCLHDDGGRLYQTPLREDLRTAAGLLHQLFVLARLCEWQSRLGEHAIPERLAQSREDLLAAHETAAAELPLTDAGRALVATIDPHRTTAVS
ncbi:aKG-HExxH-type peptide beta-hydroxylase [Phytohabitans sp. LJ34]|uniref:aKG-HExxH-type peptide beta-hydroxylase n=1 Tax=Phytohabitans sp. LJ34 TaxID=3452217 RepID=UPI003F8A782C